MEEQKTNKFKTSNLNFLADKWPSAIVARTDVGKFTGGLINPRTMANLDSASLGPAKMTVGRKVAYPVDGFIKWLESRMAA